MVLLGLTMVLVLSALSPVGRAQAASQMVTLAPIGIHTKSGATRGDVSALTVQDQSGTQNDPDLYVLLKTPRARYVGWRVYELPDGVLAGQVTNFEIKADFFGPPAGEQTWRWQLWDWSRRRWVKVGGSQAATGYYWSELVFQADDASRFVNAKGKIKLRSTSSNASRNARLDFESITVSYDEIVIPPGGNPRIAGCDVFPTNNIWNAPVYTLPVHSRSDEYLANIGLNTGLHPDFGSGEWNGGPIGIPYVVVDSGQAGVPTAFDYEDESNPGPYPIPPEAPIEGGPDSDGDRHILVIEKDNCVLYELYGAYPDGSGGWWAGSGAIFDLSSNALRPDGWTSADSAGLPIFPGLIRYEEVAVGVIEHAIRFTAPETQRAYLWPARHYASSITDVNYPPMGLRLRLRADFDISSFSPEVQVILQAMKTYGLILADNGSPWYISGVPDERWDNDVLHELSQVHGGDFEVVDASLLMADPDSGAVGP